MTDASAPLLALAALLLASLGAFALALRGLGIVGLAQASLATLAEAGRAMRAPGLDDLERERAVQRAGVRMLGQGAGLILRSVAALLAAAAPLWLADLAGWVSWGAAVAFLGSWPAILAATVLMGALWMGAARWRA